MPINIAIIDTLCDANTLEQIKTALIASLDVLPNFALFGLITFDDKVKLIKLNLNYINLKITLYDVRGKLPICRSLGLVEGIVLLCPLEDMVPLKCLLVNVAEFKENIINAIETLRPSIKVNLEEKSKKIKISIEFR